MQTVRDLSRGNPCCPPQVTVTKSAVFPPQTSSIWEKTSSPKNSHSRTHLAATGGSGGRVRKIRHATRKNAFENVARPTTIPAPVRYFTRPSDKLKLNPDSRRWGHIRVDANFALSPSLGKSFSCQPERTMRAEQFFQPARKT